MTQSPAAKTSGRLVRICRSTTIAPLHPELGAGGLRRARCRVGRRRRPGRRRPGRPSGSPPGPVALHLSGAPSAAGGLLDRVDARVAGTSTPWRSSSVVDERAELGVDGRQDFGELLDLGDLTARGW